MAGHRAWCSYETRKLDVVAMKSMDLENRSEIDTHGLALP
jgi:hypothetical protein